MKLGEAESTLFYLRGISTGLPRSAEPCMNPFAPVKVIYTSIRCSLRVRSAYRRVLLAQLKFWIKPYT